MKNNSSKFLELIQTQTLLGDGALGTELLKTANWPVNSIEGLNINAPELVKRLHKEYIAAGSLVIETNSFGANRFNLIQVNLDRKIEEINIRIKILTLRELIIFIDEKILRIFRIKTYHLFRLSIILEP